MECDEVEECGQPTKSQTMRLVAPKYAILEEEAFKVAYADSGWGLRREALESGVGGNV